MIIFDTQIKCIVPSKFLSKAKGISCSRVNFWLRTRIRRRVNSGSYKRNGTNTHHLKWNKSK